LKEDAASPGVPRRGGSGSTAEVSRVDDEESTVGWLLGGEVEEEDNGIGLSSNKRATGEGASGVGSSSTSQWGIGGRDRGLGVLGASAGLQAASLAARLGLVASIASWLGCSLRSGDPKSRIGGDGLENAGLVAETGDDVAGGVRSAQKKSLRAHER